MRYDNSEAPNDYFLLYTYTICIYIKYDDGLTIMWIQHTIFEIFMFQMKY